MTRRTRVYCAGPYSLGNIEANVAAAVQCAHTLIKRGFAPFVPHLSHYIDALDPMPYDLWLQLGKEWLTACDVVLRLPGESPGADDELALAKELHIDVYWSLDTLFACESPKRKV